MGGSCLLLTKTDNNLHKEHAQNPVRSIQFVLVNCPGTLYTTQYLVPTYPWGPYLNDVGKIFEIFDPLAPCLHFSQIYSTKFMQLVLLRLHFGTPSPYRHHLSMAPYKSSSKDHHHA